MGSLFRSRLRIFKDVSSAIRFLQKHSIRVIASTPHSNSTALQAFLNAFGKVPDACYALAVGNEASGISKALLDHSHAKVRIEMHGDIESLNVAVASGILLNRVTEKLRGEQII
mmetsp:Transcript_46342/g.74528  ORF Transcript_46342/g.74528 Transcript_46342/m.74528 type:complete len:114 (+) Transcript_46342:3-344(+)